MPWMNCENGGVDLPSFCKGHSWCNECRICAYQFCRACTEKCIDCEKYLCNNCIANIDFYPEERCPKCWDDYHDHHHIDEYAEESMNDPNQSTQDMMKESERKCECGGEIGQLEDDTADEIVLCSSCEREYKYCGSCTFFYLAKNENEKCPNDH